MRFIFVAIAAVSLISFAACGKSGEQAGGQAPQDLDSKNAGGAAVAPEKTASDIGTAVSGSAQEPLAAAQLAAAYKVLDLAPTGGGQVMNACGEAVTPSVVAADVGGEVGRAYLIVVGGGPNTLTCYGMTGMSISLLKTEGDSFRVIFSSQGSLAIMPTEHKGVKDIAVGGPGFEFPVYEWNGTEYVPSRTIKDTELPVTLN